MVAQSLIIKNITQSLIIHLGVLSQWWPEVSLLKTIKIIITMHLESLGYINH